MDNGAICIEAGTGSLFIYKRDNLTTPIMTINICLTHIQLFKTHSAHNNFLGATMQLTGWFDRGHREIVTIKMH